MGAFCLSAAITLWMLAPADDHTAPSSLRRSQHRTDASGDMRSLCVAFTATCIALLQDRPPSLILPVNIITALVSQ